MPPRPQGAAGFRQIDFPIFANSTGSMPHAPNPVLEEVPDSDLFRPEVLASDSKRAFGSVVLVYPVTNWFLLALALGLLAVLASFAVFGQYTRHASVAGVLEPSQGVVKLYPTQGGVLKAALVREGQAVRKGDVLLVFGLEHADASGRPVEAEVDAKLRQQIANLHTELGGSLKLHEADAASQRQTLAALQRNRAILQSEIQTQTKRVQSAEQAAARFERLRKDGFMPELQTQQRQDELMDQQLRLQSLHSAATSADADIERLARAIESTPLKRQVAQAQIARSLAGTESELSRQQAGRAWSLVAPCDGVVASLTITHGQSATGGAPLVTIVPAGAQLQATLYAPSRSLGFLRVGQPVKMKLDAFPFQKFGVAEGTVLSIADSPVRAAEASPGNRLATSYDTGEPLYTVRVALARRFPPEAFGMVVPPGFTGCNPLPATKHAETKALRYRLASHVSSRVLVWTDLDIGDDLIFYEGANIQPFAMMVPAG